MSQDLRVKKFIASITREAEKERDEIIREQQEYIDAAVLRAKKSAEHDERVAVRRKMSRLKGEVGRDFAKKQSGLRNELFSYRDNITNSVFDEVKAKVADFTKSPEYKNFMLSTAKKAATAVGENGCIVYIRKEDSALSDDILSAIEGASVCIDDEITLGGVKVKNAAGSLVANDTIDVRIKAELERFKESCGMMIEQNGE